MFFIWMNDMFYYFPIYEAELGSNILISKTYTTIYKTYINFSYIYS